MAPLTGSSDPLVSISARNVAALSLLHPIVVLVPCMAREIGEESVAEASGRTLFAPELIRCVTNGRDPSAAELFSVARQVWVEGASQRSAFSWNHLSRQDPERLAALRVAQAALSGSATE